MALSTWKARVLERVTEAGGCFDSAHGWLVDEVDRLTPPMHVADAQAARGRIRHALDVVSGVSFDLDVAVSAMAAAEIIALHGAAADPMDPLLSIDTFPRREHSMQDALRELRRAQYFADQAYSSVARCYACLLATFFLLNHPGLPGVDGFLDTERVDARNNLQAALEFALQGEMMVITARPLVR